MPASSEGVAALVAAVQRGDAAETRAFLDRYRPHLASLARRKQRSLPAGQRPSDLVQDTLERVVRCLHQFQGTTDPELRRWLAVILENVLIQQQRAARRQRRAAELVPLPESDQLRMPEPQPGPSQILRGHEEWRALLRAVHALPAGQRDAVHRYLRGEEVAEIARQLSRKPGAVSCLLQRGGKKLQVALGGQGSLGPWFQTMRRLLAEAD